MPSIQSRLFIFALKYRHLLRGQLRRRSMITFDTSIPKLREEIEKGADFFGKVPEGMELCPVSIGALKAEWMIPQGSSGDRVILYFHGGGYATGSIKAHRMIVAKFVKGAALPALLFDYRLAPENPFPAAVEDSLSAYRWLLGQGISPSRIAFIGDSAGGGLCLATMLALKDGGMPLPAAAAALSPWTDVKNTGDSWHANAGVDTLSWQEAQVVLGRYYAGDTDPEHPWMSPLYGDLSGLPPTLIYAGGDELLLDDSTRFAEKAEKAGVDVTLRIGKGMFHCYPACAPLFPEAREAMEEICRFIGSHTAGRGGAEKLQGRPCSSVKC
jgi:acetyl esterase/lipase